MSDYAYIRATETGPWHIYRLGYPGAVFDQPLCGQLLTYETCYSMPIVGNIDYEALTPLCESCRVAYSGLVHFGVRAAERYGGGARTMRILRGACAEAVKLSNCLRELEMTGALDKAQADFLLSLVNAISGKLARVRDERDDAVRMLEESDQKLNSALKILEKKD